MSEEEEVRKKLVQELRGAPSKLKLVTELTEHSARQLGLEAAYRSFLREKNLKEPKGRSEEEVRILRVRQACLALWPEHWEVLEACLTAGVSLTMEDVDQGLALVLYGKSSDGKTTILEWLQGADQAIWRTKITPASLMSGVTEMDKSKLEANAFVKTAKHKIVLVGDLNPMIHANDDRVSRGYSDFGVWLDGTGATAEYGGHGTVGEHGDFTFVLLGAKTPMKQKLWSDLAQLGMRLLYIRMKHYSGLVPSSQYTSMKNLMRYICTTHLNWFFTTHPVRSLPWPTAREDQLDQINRLGKLVEIAQQHRPGERQGGGHVAHRLNILTHARALLYGRTRLEDSDLLAASRIAVSSSWGRRGYILKALDDGLSEAGDLASACGLTPPNCIALLKAMKANGCITHDPFSRPTQWKIVEEDELID